METRQRKRLTQERNIIRTLILQRDSKNQTAKSRKNCWLTKNCMKCEKVRSVLDPCTICQQTVSTDNIVLPFCQHYFCRKCIYEYLDRTSIKYKPFYAESDSEHGAESFKCPTCKIYYSQLHRGLHLRKNYLYSAIHTALHMPREPKEGEEC